MPVQGEAFSYAILRVVPSEARGERLNVGVVVFSRRLNYLAMRVSVDRDRLRALDGDLDVEALEAHLDGLSRIAAGDPAAGPIARLDLSERFHWLAAPSNTIVQPSPVHTGVCDDAERMLDRLAAELL